MRIFTIIALLLIAQAATASAAAPLQGEVVGISDGDTLTLLTSEQRQVKVRLAQLDTPERHQPYGSRAKQALADKVFRRRITVQVEAIDRYGRTVGTVYLDGRDVNAEMVAEGHAWVYRAYSRDPGLLELERSARTERRGLWALSEAERTPPWEWRRQRRAPQLSSRTTSFSCGSKRYCRQMNSCAEASYFLSRCGVSSLDGDGDGIPCESRCR